MNIAINSFILPRAFWELEFMVGYMYAARHNIQPETINKIEKYLEFFFHYIDRLSLFMDNIVYVMRR